MHTTLARAPGCVKIGKSETSHGLATTVPAQTFVVGRVSSSSHICTLALKSAFPRLPVLIIFPVHFTPLLDCFAIYHTASNSQPTDGLRSQENTVFVRAVCEQSSVQFYTRERNLPKTISSPSRLEQFWTDQAALLSAPVGYCGSQLVRVGKSRLQFQIL
jgi:hypothetical protein